MRIARETIANELGVNPRATAFGMLQLFEHHRARAFTDHEAVALSIPRSRSLQGAIVETGGDGTHDRKASEGEPTRGCLRAGREHHVRVAQRDQATGVAQRVRAGRTSGHDGVVWPAKTMANRHHAD